MCFFFIIICRYLNFHTVCGCLKPVERVYKRICVYSVLILRYTSTNLSWISRSSLSLFWFGVKELILNDRHAVYWDAFVHCLLPHQKAIYITLGVIHGQNVLYIIYTLNNVRPKRQRINAGFSITKRPLIIKSYYVGMWYLRSCSEFVLQNCMLIYPS